MKTIPEPTIPELAMIAAALARNFSDDMNLASRAMTLWFSAAHEIEQAQERAKQSEAAIPYKPPFESPKQFPVSLDDALRLWLPHVKEPDRWKAYRDYLDAGRLRAKILNEHYKTGMKDEPTEATLKRHKAEMMDQLLFQIASGHFLAWRKTAISECRASAGSMGGRKNKRHVKKKKLG